MRRSWLESVAAFVLVAFGAMCGTALAAPGGGHGGGHGGGGFGGGHGGGGFGGGHSHGSGGFGGSHSHGGGGFGGSAPRSNPFPSGGFRPPTQSSHSPGNLGGSILGHKLPPVTSLPGSSNSGKSPTGGILGSSHRPPMGTQPPVVPIGSLGSSKLPGGLTLPGGGPGSGGKGGGSGGKGGGSGTGTGGGMGTGGKGGGSGPWTGGGGSGGKGGGSGTGTGGGMGTGGKGGGSGPWTGGGGSGGKGGGSGPGTGGGSGSGGGRGGGSGPWTGGGGPGGSPHHHPHHPHHHHHHPGPVIVLGTIPFGGFGGYSPPVFTTPIVTTPVLTTPVVIPQPAVVSAAPLASAVTAAANGLSDLGLADLGQAAAQAAGVVTKRAQVPVGSTVTLNGDNLGAAAGRVVLVLDKLSLAAVLNDWQANSATATLPDVGIEGPTPAELLLVKADGQPASSVQIELINPEYPPEKLAENGASDRS